MLDPPLHATIIHFYILRVNDTDYAILSAFYCAIFIFMSLFLMNQVVL